MMMKFIRSLLVGVTILLFSANLGAKSDTAESGYYTQKDKEFYLTSDEIFFIRPGLELEIVNVAIPADMQPEVTFSIKDPGGLPLDMNGVYTPGPLDTMRYSLTYIPQGEEQKVILAGLLYDSGGTLTMLGDGEYMYKFATVLGDNYDPDATHTLGVHARRDLTEFDLGYYVDEEIYNFVPSGSSEPVPRDVVTTETCNGRCHDPLGMHAEYGGPFTDVPWCTQCHNPTLPFDDSDHLTFNVLIHSVHAGNDPNIGEVHYPADLNECEVCHTGGTPTAAFPIVANPNPIPVCDGSQYGKTTISWDYPGRLQVRTESENGNPFLTERVAGFRETGKWVRDGLEFFAVDADTEEVLQKLRVNTTVLGCSGNAPGTYRGKPGAQHTNWLDHPSRAVCGSCHTEVNFATGAGHSEIGIVQTNDDACHFCHLPSTGVEFDASIRGAHLPVYKSTQLPGVLFEFIEIVNTAAGQRPTVTFSLRSKEEPLDPANLDRLRLTITGPNTDWSYYHQENVGSLAKRAGPYWTYTFATPLPLDAKGSYTVSVEGRNLIEVDFGNETSEERDQIENSLLAFAVTDATPVARRMVVDDYNCESCHSNLSEHGSNRHDPQYCNTCHRADLTDAEGRPAEAGPADSIHFKYMIHKIHRGAELENGYTVYDEGDGEDLGHVEFSGDLRNCEKCHVNESYELPLPAGLLATSTPANWFTPMQPATAACLSCHDGEDAAAHAYSNTTFFGEACGACHGENMSFAVDKVHAR